MIYFRCKSVDGLIVTAPVIMTGTKLFKKSKSSAQEKKTRSSCFTLSGWPGLKPSRPALEWDNDPYLADFKGLNGIMAHILQHLGDLVKLI